MAITPPAPPQQQQQQQQQQENQQEHNSNSNSSNNNNKQQQQQQQQQQQPQEKKTTTAATTTRKRFFAEQIRRHVDAVLPTASCRKFRRLIPSHGSLRLSSLRCYYDATLKPEAFNATTMLRFRSGTSVDAIRSRGSIGPGSRRRYYNATVSLGNFRRRGSEAKVRSGLEAVDATTMVGFRSGTSVDAVPKQRFAQA